MGVETKHLAGLKNKHQNYLQIAVKTAHPARKPQYSYITNYWWWKKSCTTLHVWNSVNNGILTISSTGAGFPPSKVLHQKYYQPCVCLFPLEWRDPMKCCPNKKMLWLLKRELAPCSWSQSSDLEYIYIYLVPPSRDFVFKIILGGTKNKGQIFVVSHPSNTCFLYPNRTVWRRFHFRMCPKYQGIICPQGACTSACLFW